MKHLHNPTFLLLLLCLAAQAQTYKLQYNLEKGKTYYFETIARQNIDMGVGETMDQEIITGIDITVTDISPEGNYNCSIIYKKMQIVNSAWEKMGMQKYMDMSSDAIRGLGYNFVMDKQGKSLLVTNVDDFINRYADSMIVQMDGLVNRGDNETLRDEFVTKLKKQFSDSTLARDLDNITGGFLPDKPVKLNEKWVRKSKSTVMFDRESTINFTLNEVKDGVATITASGKSKATGESEFASVDLKPNMDMKTTSTYKIDMTTGLIISGNSVITGEGTMASNGKKNKMKMVSNNTSIQYELK